MALLFTEGWDTYASTTGDDFIIKWPVQIPGDGLNWASTEGRGGGGCLYTTDRGGVDLDYVRRQVIPVDDEAANSDWAVGFWVRTETSTSTSAIHPIMRIGSLSDSLVTVNIQPSISGVIFDNYGTSTDLVTGYASIADTQWHWIEFRYVAANGTSGSLQCYVDGVRIINLTATDTIASGSGTFGYIEFRATADQVVNYYIDDIIVYDDSGTELRTSVDFPVGPLKIETSLPTSTGANEDFTGVGSTSNVLNVDETVHDGDATYNGTETSTGAVDTFGYASLASTGITQVVGLSVNTVSRKEGLGDISVRAVAISSASTSNGAPTSQTGGYTLAQAPFVYDPATSTRWTTAGLDAAEFGYATSSST